MSVLDFDANDLHLQIVRFPFIAQYNSIRLRFILKTRRHPIHKGLHEKGKYFAHFINIFLCRWLVEDGYLRSTRKSDGDNDRVDVNDGNDFVCPVFTSRI